MRGYWDLVEPYWETINIYDGPSVFNATFAEAPLAAGLLCAAHWCDSEVCNGGFRQFFENSTGVLAPEALRGFEAIGQEKIAGLVRQAIELLGPWYPRDRTERTQKLVPSVLARLSELDDEYYALRAVDAGGFEAAADKYAEATQNS